MNWAAVWQASRGWIQAQRNTTQHSIIYNIMLKSLSLDSLIGLLGAWNLYSLSLTGHPLVRLVGSLGRFVCPAAIWASRQLTSGHSLNWELTISCCATRSRQVALSCCCCCCCKEERNESLLFVRVENEHKKQHHQTASAAIFFNIHKNAESESERELGLLLLFAAFERISISQAKKNTNSESERRK